MIFKVLIETYWNVNLYFPHTPDVFLCVLIETYWNVNPDPLTAPDPAGLS